jgi:hypothetical protein
MLRNMLIRNVIHTFEQTDEDLCLIHIISALDYLLFELMEVDRE